MNEEIKIKLQAYLDEEISNADAREVSELLAKNTDAKNLLTELQFVKSALRGNELEIKLPEARDFYWSKIERQIERESKESARPALFSWWKPAYVRFAGGLAATCALLMISVIAFNNVTPEEYASVPSEIEGNGEMGAITYHSNADGMTVVYLFDREPVEMVDSQPN